MILRGDWRTFIKDLQEWTTYAKEKKLVSKRKSSKGPNLSQLRNTERYNQFSKLRKVLLQAGMKATVDMNTVKKKHPEGEDIPPDFWTAERLNAEREAAGDLPDQISTKNMEYMIKMLRELDATSSGSIDGAVYNDLRCIARRFSETEVLGRPREVMADPATRFIIQTIYNVARGRVERKAAVIMAACRLIMIDKKGGGERPIAVGHIYRRLAGRFLEQTNRSSRIKAFGPKQLATQSNGTNMAALNMQIHLEAHRDQIEVSMDCTNAFNSGDRKVLLREMIRRTPWNFKYAKTFYSEKARLRVVQAPTEDDKFIWSSEGTQQGDPLGMTMFCAGMALIIEAAEKYIEVLREEWRAERPNEEPEWLFVVFADDIFICAPPVIAAKLYAHIAYIAKKELNLVFNDEKTRFASMGNTKKLTKSLKKAFSDVQRHTTDDFPLMTIDEKSIEKFKVLPGADALGVPVGTRDYRIAGVLRKFAKTQREWALANSHVSSAQTRFNVLHHCLRTTFTHLIRALGPEIFGSRLERKHFEECNEHIRKTNEEDSKEGNFMLLKEVVMPAGPTSFSGNISTIGLVVRPCR